MVNWMAIAIIFITLFCLETLIITIVYQAGLQEIERENFCGSECFISDMTAVYISDGQRCICYVNGEAVKAFVVP
jgi:hypothetical protein